MCVWYWLTLGAAAVVTIEKLVTPGPPSPFQTSHTPANANGLVMGRKASAASVRTWR
jgi:hypothetical protein